MDAGEQLPGALEEGHRLVGVQQGLAAGERHVAQMRARARPGLQLPHDVAGAGGPPVEVGLVGIEAEEAAPRAGERHHVRLGVKPQAARLAGWGLPAGDQALPVVERAHTQRRELLHSRLAVALVDRLRERHAEVRHRLTEALLDVHVALRVAPERRIGDVPDVRHRHLLHHEPPSFALALSIPPRTAESRSPAKRNGSQSVYTKGPGYTITCVKDSSKAACRGSMRRLGWVVSSLGRHGSALTAPSP